MKSYPPLPQKKKGGGLKLLKASNNVTNKISEKKSGKYNAAKTPNF